jgi:MFS family permease
MTFSTWRRGASRHEIQGSKCACCASQGLDQRLRRRREVRRGNDALLRKHGRPRRDVAGAGLQQGVQLGEVLVDGGQRHAGTLGDLRVGRGKRALRGVQLGRRDDNPAMTEALTRGRARDRRLVLWLSLAQLITWGGVFYTFSVLLEPVERELGLTRAQSSLAFSLALAAEGTFAYAVGRWIDAGRERAVMAGGSLLAGVCLLAHSAVTTLAGFYAVWFGLGAALAATLYTPVFSVVTRRFPHEFRRAIITLTFLGGLASTVFIPLSAWLIAHVGWRHALWALAAMQLFVCMPIHAVQLRDAPPPLARAHTAMAPPSTHLRSAPYLLLGVFIVGMMAVTAALPPHMIPLLRGSGLDERWVIAIPASIGAIQVLGRVLQFFFEHRFDVHAANRVIPTLIPVGIAFLIAGAGHAWAALVFVIFYGLGNGMMTIVRGTAIAQYVSRENIASLNGALGVPSAIARAITPWLMGALWTAQAGYTWGLAVLLVIGVLSTAALVAAQKIALRRKATGSAQASA